MAGGGRGGAAVAGGGPGVTRAPNPHPSLPGRTLQCGPHTYQLGLFGWRRRCLYVVLLLLLLMVMLNLALTLFILRVLDVTTEGMGGLQIVRGGLIASGEVHVLDTLVAARILSRPHTPIAFLAHDNFSIAATDGDGRLATNILMDTRAMTCTAERVLIKDKLGRLLFSATRDQVVVGAKQLKVTGEGGTVVSGSVQTSHVTAPISESLLLESMTRSIEVSAPQGVAIESRAGTIHATSLRDLTLQSTAGKIVLDSSHVVLRGLNTSTTQTKNPQDAQPYVYQMCVCSSGRLFLARPTGVCAADHNFCK